MAKKKAPSKTKKKLAKKSSNKKTLQIDDSNFVFDNIQIPLILLDNKARIRRVNDTGMEKFVDGIISYYTNQSYFELLS